MKLSKPRVNKDGTISVTLRIHPQDTVLLRDGKAKLISAEPFVVDPGYHYQLGGQVNDIVAAHVISEAVPVYWCSILQKWADAT